MLQIGEREYLFSQVSFNLAPQELVKLIVERGEGELDSNGAVVCRTGKFTGRSPNDRLIVKDDANSANVCWGDINIPCDAQLFQNLSNKLISQLQNKQVFVQECSACSDPECRFNIRVISATAYHALFVDNMFLRFRERPAEAKPSSTQFVPDITIIVDPYFLANPAKDGVKNENFVLLDIQRRIICVGGTGYTGEVKKGVFSLLNYLLPLQHNTLGMHCGANIGANKDVALFFGLSGTGKTTLSSDPKRCLIGDDEHGWNENGIFNMEGGCYAKVINLNQKNEPMIWNSIRSGALLENVKFISGTNQVDYTDTSITPNTRVSYPIHHIENYYTETSAPHPQNIFFLSCDAFGVLPPLALLNEEQTAYYFLCGYTAKVAGTEQGVNQPTAALSTCFGAPFLPLRAKVYTQMLKDRINIAKTKVWLVNTGWSGGPYGVGERMPLKYTRGLIDAVLNNQLKEEDFAPHPLFDFAVPQECPPIPTSILNPQDTWQDKEAYWTQAQKIKRQMDEFVAKNTD